MSAITILFIFVPILVGILLMANILLAPNRPYSEKVTEYECGYQGVLGQTRSPFSISYYLVGILFMLFDLEVLLLYPIAVTMSDLTLRGNNDFRWSYNNGICRGNCFTSTLLNNVQHQLRHLLDNVIYKFYFPFFFTSKKRISYHIK